MANSLHPCLLRLYPSSLAVASVHSTLSSAQPRSHNLFITVCVPQAPTSHKARPRLLMMMTIPSLSKRSGCNISARTAPVILVSCQPWSKGPTLRLPTLADDAPRVERYNEVFLRGFRSDYFIRSFLNEASGRFITPRYFPN